MHVVTQPNAPRPFSVLRDEVMADPERAARVEQIKENVMIDEQYKPRAQRAVDLLRVALIAVEECGADVELTNIVVAVSDAQMTLRRLFDLPGPGLQIKVDLDPEEIVSIDRYLDGA